MGSSLFMAPPSGWAPRGPQPEPGKIDHGHQEEHGRHEGSHQEPGAPEPVPQGQQLSAQVEDPDQNQGRQEQAQGPLPLFSP